MVACAKEIIPGAWRTEFVWRHKPAAKSPGGGKYNINIEDSRMMKNIIVRTFILTVFTALASCALAAESDRGPLRVIPAPKQVAWRDGAFDIGPGTVIVPSDEASDNDRFAIELLRDEMMSRLGVKPEVALEEKPGGTIIVGSIDDAAAQRMAAHHGIDPREVAIAEGYTISISPAGVLLAGADDDGVFYAVQTLRQILRSHDADGSLPAMRVDDWPSYSFRGVTDDISRGPVPTMDTIKQTLRRLSELKVNRFNLYIEHVFEFEKHPVIGPEGGSLTAAQIREIDDYARAYHIELVGGLQSFGHMYHILKHKQYSHLAETPFNPWEITPARKESYRLLGDMFAEIAPAFSSKLFNISCDETWTLGTGRARRMVEEKGIEWTYAYHIRRVREMLVQRHGKRVMMWADIALKHPDIIEMLPMDIIFLPWNYNARESFDDMLAPMRASGHDFIVCPGVSCWRRMFPDIGVAETNIGNFARDGMKYRAMGVLNTTWDDDGENLFGYNWYPLAWGAEVSWNPLRQDLPRFRDSFPRAFYSLQSDSVSGALRRLSDSADFSVLDGLPNDKYWHWPVLKLRPTLEGAEQDARRLLKNADKAELTLERAAADAGSNAENIDYALFAARRVKDLAQRRVAFFMVSGIYAKAFEHRDGDTDKVLKALENCDTILQQAQRNLWDIFKEYRKLWMRENRPYWFENNEEKFSALDARIAGTREAIAAAAELYRETGELPAPDEIGLAAP